MPSAIVSAAKSSPGGYSLYPDDDDQLIRIYRTKYLVEAMTAGPRSTNKPS